MIEIGIITFPTRRFELLVLPPDVIIRIGHAGIFISRVKKTDATAYNALGRVQKNRPRDAASDSDDIPVGK